MIRIENINAGYGKNNVLSDLSLSLENGKITAITGPNGCGKSTLLKAVCGLIPISCGKITVDGKAAPHMKPNELAQRVSYLPQTRSLPDMSVFQLILHGRFPHLSFPKVYGKADHAAAEAAILQMGLSHVAHKRLSTLSGGILQKAYIAMALCQNADHILLDEPTTHLDVSHSFSLMDTLLDLKQNHRAIVTVIHDLTLAMNYSDTVVVMDEGRVLAVGTPDYILSSGIIRKVFGVGLECSSSNGEVSYYYTK